VFIEAKDDGSGGDNWSYKSCKAPVKSSPPTNRQPVVLQAGCPTCRPTNSVKAVKGLAYPKLTRGLPTLSLTTDVKIMWNSKQSESANLCKGDEFIGFIVLFSRH